MPELIPLALGAGELLGGAGIAEAGLGGALAGGAGLGVEGLGLGAAGLGGAGLGAEALGGGAASQVAAAGLPAGMAGGADLGTLAGLGGAAGGLQAPGFAQTGGITPAADPFNPANWTGWSNVTTGEGGTFPVGTSAAPAAPGPANVSLAPGITPGAGAGDLTAGQFNLSDPIWGQTNLTAPPQSGLDIPAPAGPSPTISQLTAGTTPPTTGFSGATAPTATAPGGDVLSQLAKNPFGTLGEGAAKSLTANPLGIGLAGAGLGYSLMQGQKQTAAQDQLNAQAGQLLPQAAQLAAQGQEYAGYLSSGTLPTGIQAQLDQATNAAKQQVISNFAAQGMNTDPNHNSTLAATLADIDQKALVTKGQLETQLLTAGSNLIGQGTQISALESQIFTTLANLDQTQTQQVGQAIANFAGAFSPSRVNINLGKT